MQRNAGRCVFMSAIVNAISPVLGGVISIKKHVLLTNTLIYKHIKPMKGKNSQIQSEQVYPLT